MWHEARKREKATQKLFNDHKRRAEKRREENRIDPNSLLQINGIKSKLNLDPHVYKQAVKSLVAWQGDKSVTIDRFDVRATLTSIPNDGSPTKTKQQQQGNHHDQPSSSPRNLTVLDADESNSMKRLLDYERYRLLIQNDLDKMPEELRLKLVANSDFSSDAKMRKLRNNRFGTSGETGVSQVNLVTSNSNRLLQSKIDQRMKRGATIGFSYNSVPPPQGLTDNTFHQQSNDDSTSDRQQTSTMRVIDLDEFDNLELDSVNVSRADKKRVYEIARKYGLSSEEFLLLAKKDGHESGNGEILKELNQLINKKNQVAGTDANNPATDLICKQQSQVYGPALPPEFMVKANRQHQESLFTPDSVSSAGSSPVGQRSPSGANIPRRDGTRSDLSNCATETDTSKSPDRRQISSSSKPCVSPQSRAYQESNENPSSKVKESNFASRTNQTMCTDSLMTPRILAPGASGLSSHSRPEPSSLTSTFIDGTSLCESPRLSHQGNQRVSNGLKEVSENPSRSGSRDRSPSSANASRRASTPLAYKRNCRSSRSLSRERRDRYRSSRRRHISRSDSSPLSPSPSRSSSSSSPPSSLSSSSPDRSRRRRNSRSRSRKKRRR